MISELTCKKCQAFMKFFLISGLYAISNEFQESGLNKGSTAYQMGSFQVPQNRGQKRPNRPSWNALATNGNNVGKKNGTSILPARNRQSSTHM